MPDLSFLIREPPVAPVELSTTDPRFAEVVQRVDAGAHSDAAEKALALVDEGIWDVRLIGVLLYAAFTAEGLTALAPSLGSFAALVESHSDKLGPSRRLERHLAKTVGSLFERVQSTLSYHLQKGGAELERLVGPGGAPKETAEAAERALAAVPAAVRPELEEAASKLLRVLRELVAAPQRPIEEPVAAPPPAEEPPVSRPRLEAPECLQLTPSAALRELLAKIQAFERLVARRDFRKAALVAADVQASIETFDPRKYFPELFAGFGGQLAEHIEQIAPQWEQKDSVSWQMLEQWYRVDLAGFTGVDE